MTPQTINSNLPIGTLLHEIGAKTKQWAGGMNVTVQVPGEGVRNFRYDFAESIWFEQFEFDNSRPISAAVVRGVVERIFTSMQ
jgi:hypothetical protein